MARPSLDSLGRIAVALGTSQIELLSGSAVAAESPGLQYTPARSASGVYGTGEARILASGNTRFTPFEVTGSSTEFGHYYEHEEDEFVHVVLGTLDIDLGSDGISTLGEGDSLYLPGGIPHRWASHNREPYRLFVVKERRSRD